ncbi:MAG: MFS transporter [Eubacteriales bacterium]|nr:MFS transporter [Eubacteriales bacterium]
MAEAETKKEKKSAAANPLFSSKIKSANVKLFPEAFFGYLGGPFFALVPNGIINTFLTQYWTNVLGLDKWATTFTWLMPLLSTILIVIGNLLVGKLMEGKPRKAGKARPILFLSVPLILLSLVVLFIAPFPYTQVNGEWVLANNTIWTLVVVAIGYNLFYAIAWPIYYTAHSSIVNLSTRNSSQRSFLATVVNAAQLGAAGVSGMLGGYLATWLQLVPAASDKRYWIDEDPTKINYELLWADRQAANGKWMIAMIVMLILFLVGVLLEYYFTRERITEEQFASLKAGDENTKNAPKKVSMSKQVSVCMKDSNWWIVMIFFLLYQLGGMLKNNGQLYYSQAWTGDTKLSSTISIVGAIPTALGMLVVWPLANKFTKTKSIRFGALLAVVFGFVGLIPLFVPSLLNGQPDEIAGAISGISIAGFCLKAIGTVPAMYVSMALLADVLDHEEAVYGVRTDGFTMSVYGSIMIAMTGISNAIILAFKGVYDPSVNPSSNLAAYRSCMSLIFFAGEMLCYVIIFLMFFFLKSEKFSKLDHEAISEDQKAKCVKEGIAYVDPAEKMKQEEAEADAKAEEDRKAELKATCEKKGLSFEEEEKKYEDQKALKDKQASEKKAAADKKKAEKEAVKKAKYDALPQEKKDALKAKEDAYNAAVEKDFEAIRLAHKEEREANLFA